jgi:rhodanese-related sulfurtransferase
MRLLRLFLAVMTLFSSLLVSACGGDSPRSLTAYSLSLKKEFPAVKTLSTADLAARSDSPILLDVRSEEEFAVSHIPRALRAEEDAAEQLHQLGVRDDQMVVVYCSVGYRSAKLAQELTAAGFRKVRNLEGSIFAWTNEGRPLVNSHGAAEGTHPFNRVWGRYLKKSKWRWTPEPAN